MFKVILMSHKKQKQKRQKKQKKQKKQSKYRPFYKRGLPEIPGSIFSILYRAVLPRRTPLLLGGARCTI
jgi:hypothetical protein